MLTKELEDSYYEREPSRHDSAILISELPMFYQCRLMAYDPNGFWSFTLFSLLPGCEWSELIGTIHTFNFVVCCVVSYFRTGL